MSVGLSTPDRFSIFGATLSSALACLVSAAKVFQVRLGGRGGVWGGQVTSRGRRNRM